MWRTGQLNNISCCTVSCQEGKLSNISRLPWLLTSDYYVWCSGKKIIFPRQQWKLIPWMYCLVLKKNTPKLKSNEKKEDIINLEHPFWLGNIPKCGFSFKELPTVTIKIRCTSKHKWLYKCMFQSMSQVGRSNRLEASKTFGFRWWHQRYRPNKLGLR